MANYGIDPKGGTNYLFGDRLPSDDMNNVLGWLRGMETAIGGGYIWVPLAPLWNEGDNWSPNSVSFGLGFSQDSVADAYEISFQLLIPPYAKVAELAARIDPPSGHIALPATMPTIGLGASPGEPDPSSSVAEYETPHWIVESVNVSGNRGSRPVDTTMPSVTIRGEAGANSQTGLYLQCVVAKVEPITLT